MPSDQHLNVSRGWRFWSALLTVFALVLAGCTSSPGAPVQAALRDAPSLGLPSDPGHLIGLEAQWWREFGDPQLDQLVELALRANPSLKIVEARLARARALADVTADASLPQINVGLDATRQKFTATGLYPPPPARCWRAMWRAVTSSWFA